MVKVGGSLAGSGRLTPVLEAVARAPATVVVPGGGPFADIVRAAQAREGFDDAEAHRRALLAMEELGRLLALAEPRLRPAATPQEIAAALAAGATPAWMPSAMALGRPELPASWDVTSDSLAAWLAGALGARRLVLVKAALPSRPGDLAALVADGVLDPALPGLLPALPRGAWMVAAARTDALGALLASEQGALVEADHAAARLGAHRIGPLLHREPRSDAAGARA